MAQPKLEIVPARSTWAQEHVATLSELARALGPLGVRLDAIGSTSVPGLAAKDILDLQLTVAGLDVRDELEAALAPLSFELRKEITRDHCPPGREDVPADWRKLYFDSRPPRRPTHLHVRVAGAANQRYALLFRDFLVADRNAREAYAELKRRLAALAGGDRDAYCDVKDPACDLIMNAAERWARETGWSVDS